MFLPDDFQDEIMRLLQAGSITLHEASKMAEERGYLLSHAAIADYCAAVRHEFRKVLVESRIQYSKTHGGSWPS
jgi:hypothetical protein